MPSQLALYEQLNTLHEAMAEAAFALEWDRLILLEQRSAELTAALQKSVTQTPLEAERHLAAALIQDILKKQALIRDEIKIWQDDTRPLLAVLNRSQPS